MATATTREFYRQKTEGQPDQLIDTATNKTLTPQEFNNGAGFVETKAFTREKAAGQPDKLVDTKTGVALTPKEFGTGAGFREISNAPIKSSDIENTVKAPEPTSLIGQQEALLSSKISKVAEQTFTGTKLAIDNLRAQEQAIIQQQKETAQANLDKAAKGINDIVGTTQLQEAQAANDKLFQVKDNIEKLTNISQKIVDAQEALKVGLIYEGDRPVRMSLLSGRQASLQSQGLATIGALQGSAAVIQGNITLARAYGEQTLNAIKADNANSINALNTLKTLYSNNLVTLSNDEEKIIDERLKAIEDENARIDENKDKTVELMIKYPDSFSKSGVTLLDSYEQAVSKMLPSMSQKERTLFDLEIAQKKKTLANTGKGSGDGSSGAIPKGVPRATWEEVLQLKANGATYEELSTAYGADVPLEEIKKLFPYKDGAPDTPLESITNAAYGQYVNPDGSIKEGYEATIDTKTGKPTVKKTEDSSPGFWSQIGSAFGSLFK